MHWTDVLYESYTFVCLTFQNIFFCFNVTTLMITAKIPSFTKQVISSLAIISLRQRDLVTLSYISSSVMGC